MRRQRALLKRRGQRKRFLKLLNNRAHIKLLTLGFWLRLSRE